MTELTIEQIRNFRLRSHHLDTTYDQSHISEIAGACGLQNSPPGAWETALYNRIPCLSLREMERLLYKEKLLLQTWSLRGAPVVFPTGQSSIFLSALIPQGDEPWIYTRGIGLALDYLQMSFDQVFELLKQVIPRLDGQVLVSKTTLDQTLAGWMLPLLPAGKRDLWDRPSMYGHPEVQTVGSAAVSFLLRPCAFRGLVVFGTREKGSPSFTSFQSWTGSGLTPNGDDGKELVRKYLHCYGPATACTLAAWLGCSGKQGRRLWNTVSDEIEPVTVFGKTAYILSADRPSLLAGAPLQRELLLLGGHDPYLDQRDRMVLQQDQSLHKQIWKPVANPGAVVYRGEIIGVWSGKKNSKGLELKMDLWSGPQDRKRLQELAEEYAFFRGQQLIRFA